MKSAPATVYVVEDDESVRASLDSLIRSVGMKAEMFATPAEFLTVEIPETPACLVLDVRLPGKNGLELQRELAAHKRPLPIIFITGHGDVPMSVRAMKAGAIEFLTKPFKTPDLLKAIQHAIALDQRFLRRYAERANLQKRFALLTPREKEVMDRVARGLLNKQIAAELGTTEITVKIQRGSMMKKMRANSVADRVRMVETLASGAVAHSAV